MYGLSRKNIADTHKELRRQVNKKKHTQQTASGRSYSSSNSSTISIIRDGRYSRKRAKYDKTAESVVEYFVGGMEVKLQTYLCFTISNERAKKARTQNIHSRYSRAGK